MHEGSQKGDHNKTDICQIARSNHNDIYKYILQFYRITQTLSRSILSYAHEL